MKLSRDEQETHINFTAQERIDGTINVYTDDPVWINKLDKLQGFEDVSDELGVKPPGKAFRAENSVYTLVFRGKPAMSDEQKAAAAANLKKWRDS